jgi:hypothetical protein
MASEARATQWVAFFVSESNQQRIGINQVMLSLKKF